MKYIVLCCFIGIFCTVSAQLPPAQLQCGGNVGNVGLFLISRTPNTATDAVISFTTQSDLVHYNTVTVQFPNGFFKTRVPGDGSSPIGVLSVPGRFVACCPPINPGPSSLVITVGPAGAPAGSHSVTLTGITLGPAQPSSTLVVVSTTADLPSSPAPSGQIGGTVTNVNFAILQADRIPRSTGKNVVVSFRIESKLVGGATPAQTVTIRHNGFFSAATLGTQGTSPPSQGSFSSIAVNSNNFVLSIDTSASFSASTTFTVSLTGVTMGDAMPDGTLLGVFTSNDQIGTFPSGPLGGRVSGVSFFIADADRVPTAPNKAITVSFTTATPLASGNVAIITFPTTFIVSGTTPVFDGTSKFSSVSYAADATTGTGSLTLGVTTDLVQGAFTVVIKGITFGAITQGSPCGIRVSTTHDAVQTPDVATGRLGGQVVSVSASIPPGDRIPTIQSKTVTISFTTQTQLLASNQVIISSTLFPTGSALSITGQSPDAAFSSPTFTASGLTLTSVALNPQRFTITISGITLGSPSITTTTSVRTTTDMAGSADTGSLGGQMQQVSMIMPDALRIPGATDGIVSLFFTTQTTLLATPQHSVTFSFPSGFFTGPSSPTIMSQTPASAFSSVSLTSGQFVLLVNAPTELKANTFNVTLSGLTTGVFASTNGVECITNVYASSNTDRRSINAASAGRLGGQVQNVALALGIGAGLPGQPNAVTLSFRTQTALKTSDTIIITWPSSYLTSSSPLTLTYNVPGDLTFNSAVPVTGTSNTATVTVGSAGAPPGSYTITLSGATIGNDPQFAKPPRCNPLNTMNCISVTTTADRTGFSDYQAILPRNRVQGVSVSVLEADRVANVDKQVTVSFTTQSDLQTGNAITITFPTYFVTQITSNQAYWTGPANTFQGSLAVSGLTALLTVQNTAPRGTYTVVLTVRFQGGNPFAQLSMQAICSSDFSVGVSTTKDDAGFASFPAIVQSQISNVQFSLPNPAVGDTRRSAAITFTSPVSLGSTVSISWPPGYLYGYPIYYTISKTDSSGLSQSGVANPTSASVTTPGPLPWVLPSSAFFSGISISGLQTIGAAGPGEFRVVLTNVAIGGPIPAGPSSGSTSALTVGLLPVQGVNNGMTSYPAIGGAVTATTLFIAKADRITASKRKVIVSFTTSTALNCGDTVSISFPPNFFNLNPLLNGNQQAVASSTGISGPFVVSSAGLNSQRGNMIFTIAVNGNVPAGPQTVTLCGLTFTSSTFQNVQCGVSVTTTKDWTTTYAPTGVIGAATGQVTAVSLSIPWASRIAGSSSGTAAFAFTTQSDCTSITITFPANFFVANTASCGAPPAIVVAGLPGFSLVGSNPTGPVTGPTTQTTFVFLPQSSQSLPAGSYVVTFTSVTFGVATAGSDTGITVQTNSDSVSVGVPSGPLSGYQVTAFTLPSCVASLSTCQSASVSFLSNAASIQAGSTLTITFSSTMPISGSPNQFVTSSGALVTGQVSGSSITLTVQSGFNSWIFDSGVNTIVLSGVSVVPTGLMALVGFVQIQSSGLQLSTPAFSTPYYSTSAGQTVTTSVAISTPFIGAQNAQVTVSFTTMNEINANDVIRIVFPAGFFVNRADSSTCPASSAQSVVIVSYTPSSCGTLQACAPYLRYPPQSITTTGDGFLEYVDIQQTSTGFSLPAGPKTIVLSGVFMSTRARDASSVYVITTNDACNGGSAAAPPIVPPPPPAAAASPSSELSAEARGGIIGGVLGGVAALCIVALLYRYRAKVPCFNRKPEIDNEFRTVNPL